MTLEKLLILLGHIYEEYSGISMHGSMLWANGGGELVLTFNTQPPRSLDRLLRRRGFIVVQGDYIYRPRGRAKP